MRSCASLGLRGVFCCEHSEGQCRGDGTAGAGVGFAHDGGGAVACGVEAFDDAAVFAQDAGVVICDHAAFGAEVARQDFDGVEGAFFDGAETGVGLNAWVAVVFVLFGFAAPEVGVDALVGVLIEAIDGAAQGGRLDVKLGGELFDGVGFVEEVFADAAWQLRIFGGVAGCDGADGVVVSAARIEDHPCGDGCVAFLLVFVHADDHVDVGCGFVGESHALLVDEAAIGQGFLYDQYGCEGLTWDTAGGCPPCFFHEVEGCTCFDTHLDTCAEVCWVAGCPIGLDGVALVLLAHFVVTREATGGDDDAFTSADAQCFAFVLDDEACDFAVFDDDIFCWGVEPQRHVTLFEREAQACDERVSGAQARISSVLFPFA